jgi:hypothetical protein
MQLGSSFRVPADSVTVFEKFLDPDTMRRSIPGCEELERVDETHYRGRLVNQVAHVKFNASFSAEIVEMEVPRQVRAILKGEDSRLGSSLKLNATLGVAEDPEGSLVTYAMELALWGKLGRMGESIFRRRTAEVEKQFVAAFSQACAGEELAPAGAIAAPGAEVTAPEPAVSAPAGTSAADPAAAGVVIEQGTGRGPSAAPAALAGAPAAADGPVTRREAAPVRSGGIWKRIVAALSRRFGRER